MAFEYTKDSLKASLQLWNTNADSSFVGALDEIIRRGEFSLMHLLDLESLDDTQTAVTVGGSSNVTKPSTLIVDRLLVISAGEGTRSLPRRSRAWIEMYNVAAEQGIPKWYGDLNETTWFVAPLADAVYTITVHGLYRPTSIVDGAGAGTTWFSTRVPDLLFLACSIEACEFLKFWAHKAANEAELDAKVARYLGVAAGQQRSDVEDLLGGRQNANKPSTQAE